MIEGNMLLPNFVVLDIETTGFNAERDRIIEIGAAKYLENNFDESFNQLIDPECHLPYEITKLTGISRDDLRGKPFVEQIIPKFREFIGDLPIVAHNAPFDLGFLQFNGIDFSEKEVIDTLTLSRILLPHLRDHKLITLLKYFHVKVHKSHRAYEDAVNTASLLFKLLDLLNELNSTQVQNIINLTRNTGCQMEEFFKDVAWMVMNLESAKGKKRALSQRLEKIYHFRGNVIGDVPEERSPKEELKLLDKDKIAGIFFENGVLAGKFPKYERRIQQIDMARSVSEAFNQSKFLMAEAGTGTGKSFAYLVPSIYWAMENNERVIITTKTKNLQDQLFHKDIPLIRKILDEDFSAALLKGRENYLCRRKWEVVLNSPQSRLTQEERLFTLPLVLWADYTKTGDVGENNGFKLSYNFSLWKKLNADRNTCIGAECRYYNKCFLRKVRGASANAHLVVINHYLFFSDLASDHKILGDYNYLIFDEAHNIEDVATDFLGIKMNIWEIRKTLEGIYKRGANETGVTIGLRTALKRSQLPESQEKPISAKNEEIIERCKECEKNTNAFFQKITEFLGTLPKDPYYPHQKIRYNFNHKFVGYVKFEYEELMAGLKEILEYIDTLLDWLPDIKKDALMGIGSFIDDFEVYRTDLQYIIESLIFLLTAEDENTVFWVESPRKDGAFDARLFSAPLSIAGTMNTMFYERVRSAIFTSATLTVGKTFDFFKHRLGLSFVPEDRFETVSVGAPFSYQKQSMVCVPSYLPSPKTGGKFNEKITEFIENVVAYSRRGSLVLFTSYSMLNHVYDNLKSKLESEGILVLGQGLDGSNNQILDEFKEIHESLLLGTDSFWEGVDVPGDSLQFLFVTKLPFASPGEPIVQARIEAIEKEGGNAFYQYSIPMAVIQFRQGFGRLIRTKNDKGVVFVLDNRVVTTRYGRVFLQSLPLPHIEFRNPKELGRRLKQWLLVN